VTAADEVAWRARGQAHQRAGRNVDALLCYREAVAADRYAIGREHGAVAVDMETETVARLCAAKSIPMLALRVVSDSPGAPFPAPPNVLFDIEKQRTDFSRLLGYIARNPASALSLAQFSNQIAHTKTKLADALTAVIAVL